MIATPTFSFCAACSDFDCINAPVTGRSDRWMKHLQIYGLNMRFCCQAKKTSICIAVAICLPVLAHAQQIVSTPNSAYQQVRGVPFQRTVLTDVAQVIPSTQAFKSRQPEATARLISTNATHGNAIATSYLTDDFCDETSGKNNDHPQASPIQSAHVVVQPPLVQPYKNNQYSFVIENRGNLDASDVSIEISVNEHARIVAMLPSEAVVTDEKALLTIKKLHAGEHYNVHLTATSSTDEPIVFQAKLVHSSVQNFDAKRGTPQITVGSTARHQTTSAQPYTLSELPTATEHEVPIVSGKQEYQPRPHFQTNPHYQGEQNGRELPVREMYTASPAPGNSGGFRVSVGSDSKSTAQVEISASAIPSTPEDFSPTESDIVGIHSIKDDLTKDVSENDPIIAEHAAPVMGPRNMDQLATREFSLSITNPSQNEVNNVFVQLRVPEGLEIVTFDRQTWYDEVARTVSFNIPSIAAGDAEAVHYQLKATGTGFQIQKLLIEAEGLEHPEIRFDTFIQD